MQSYITLENVCQKFKSEEVLKNVSVGFQKGNIYGIVGKNGSGKTLLFKTIVGFIRPTSGHVCVDQKEIGVDVDFVENVGLIIETPGFLSQYTAYKNLLYLADIRKKITGQQVIDAINRVGLDAANRKKVRNYSLGMRQRLAISQEIMEEPELIVLDEPMNGLDREGIKLVKELLQELREKGKTILLSSHYAEDVDICDMVYEMEHGELREHKRNSIG